MWEALLFLHTSEGSVARGGLEHLIRSRLESETFGSCGANTETKQVSMERGGGRKGAACGGGRESGTLYRLRIVWPAYSTASRLYPGGQQPPLSPLYSTACNLRLDLPKPYTQTLKSFPPPNQKVHQVFSTRGPRDFVMMRTKGVNGEGGKYGPH